MKTTSCVVLAAGISACTAFAPTSSFTGSVVVRAPAARAVKGEFCSCSQLALATLQIWAAAGAYDT
jgi:hypothetical protein